MFATCLLNSVITASDGTEGFYTREEGSPEELGDEGQPLKGKLVKIKEDDEGEEFYDSMAALTQQVQYEYEARCGQIWDEHNFSFSAQDDKWSQTWGKRTGLPLADYRSRWESLPEAPLERIVYPTTSRLAGSVMSRSSGALYNMVQIKAAQYMNSFPGPDNLGGNTDCHPGFYQLVKGAFIDFDELYYLNNVLDYRQGKLVQAESYCTALKIGVPEDQQIRHFDQRQWQLSYFKARNGKSAESVRASELLKRFDTIRSWLIQLGIFDSPLPGQGNSYSKPRIYLAARLAESKMPEKQIRQLLEELAQCTYSLSCRYSNLF